MRAFMRDKTNIEISDYEYDRYRDIKAMDEGRKEKAVLNLGGKSCRLKDIKIIGEWCHNEKCDAFERFGLQAHPAGIICEYDYTGECEVCGKKIWEIGKEYSQYKFGKVVCYEHSVYGKIPKSPDPVQRMKDAAIASIPPDASSDRINKMNEFLRRVEKKTYPQLNDGS